MAEQFRVLDAIAPGRIDLGVGRAPGSDRLTAYALNPDADASVERFPRQVLDLSHWLQGLPLEPDHPFAAITAHPRGPTSPELWILGRSNYGAQLAAHFGLPYAYAYFFSEGRGVEDALRIYRESFRPSPSTPVPKATICIWALAADTEAEARRLLKTREHWRIGFEKGIRDPLVSPDEAAHYPYTSTERERIDAVRSKAFVGDAAQVAGRLRGEAERLDLDELVIVTWTFDPEARRRSYTLLAEQFGLKATSQ